MLPRILRLPVGTSRRAYSFFSSKPGGGRYFNSSKPQKVAPASATASSTSKVKGKSTEGSPSASSSSPPASDDVPPNHLNEPDAPPPTPQHAAAPPLPPHPTFSSHTYPLHQFLSLHRPLLLLSLPTSTLFEPSVASFDDATTHSPLDAETVQFEEHAVSSTDADADAARQLARALALNRVGGWVDWEETLARLGDLESLRVLRPPAPAEGLECGVRMDSTKRKRRKKMSKHKYKKRRRLQRAARQKLGK